MSEQESQGKDGFAEEPSISLCQICETEERKETPSTGRCEICWGRMCQQHTIVNVGQIPLCSDCYQLITRMFPQILQEVKE